MKAKLISKDGLTKKIEVSYAAGTVRTYIGEKFTGIDCVGMYRNYKATGKRTKNGKRLIFREE